MILAGFLLVACQTSEPKRPAPRSSLPREVRAQLNPSRDVTSSSARIPVIGGSAREVDEDETRELSLEFVLRAVNENFPLVMAALEEVEIARAQALGAQGAFDTNLVAKSKIQAEGFYETEQVAVQLQQPTRYLGATLSTGYRLGSGDFAIWDGKLKTDDGGEFNVGLNLPLLRNRAVDARRTAEWTSLLELERSGPLVRQKRNESLRKAAESYWKWVAAGGRQRVAQALLDLAETRQSQVELAVEEGLLAPIAVMDNERLIVERRTKLLSAIRKVQEAAINLSLFARDPDGLPIVPSDEELPSGFPDPRAPDQILRGDALDLAVDQRPELEQIQLRLKQLELQLELANNSLLPQFDLGVLASQDVGPTVNDPDDKGPFEVAVAVDFRLPLQRRKPRGKVRELESKVRKQQRELQFARDVVMAEVKDEASALQQSWLRIEQARENARLAEALAEAEKIQVDAGESDLFRLNLREQQSAMASETLVRVLEEYFRAATRYSTALGVGFDEVVFASSPQ